MLGGGLYFSLGKLIDSLGGTILEEIWILGVPRTHKEQHWGRVWVYNIISRAWELCDLQ